MKKTANVPRDADFRQPIGILQLECISFSVNIFSRSPPKAQPRSISMLKHLYPRVVKAEPSPD
jgi:hypothetical protein